jgi:hypothetical protein
MVGQIKRVKTMLTIKIKTANDAYQGDNLIDELQRNLDDVKLKLEQGNKQGIVIDLNGNLTGNFKLTKRN